MRTAILTLAALALAGAIPVAAQSTLPDLTGTWQADTPEGPQRLVVRGDSVVQFGQDSVSWRQTADSVFLLLGGEWIGYHYVVRGSTLTLSGGDLIDPIVLRRIAPERASPAHLTRDVARIGSSALAR